MHISILPLGFLLALLVPTTALANHQDDSTPLSPRERAMHLLSRFSFGPRSMDVERVLEIGEAAWIEQQLGSELTGPEALAQRLGELKTLGKSPLELFKFTSYDLPPNPTREDNAKRSRKRAIPKHELMESLILRATFSNRQLEEVLCDFWRNHFNVSYTKEFPAELYITGYEYQVIQANALGNFAKMLSASAHHPAMMHYLDNALSRRPPSSEELAAIESNVRQETGSKERAKEAALIAAQRGVNENYARELLELHTLGVDRTYRQKDVVAVAEALTGWGISSEREGLEFKFNYGVHVVGDKKFLGHVLRKDKDQGPAQGERILELLGKHDDTANFIATKLVRYLVNDDPPANLVKEVAGVYKKTGGEIVSMLRVILASDEFWQRRNYRAKFKTPNEFLVSALRVTGAEVKDAGVCFKALEAMGQLTYHCDDPTGWYDTADAWLDPGVMAKRWEIALLLAANELEGIEVPATLFGEVTQDSTPLEWMRGMVDKVLPGGASTRTLTMLHEVVREHMNEGAEPDLRVLGPLVLGLLLGSPEFQEQ